MSEKLGPETHLDRISDQEGVFKEVDRKSPEIMSALVDAPVYKKFAAVIARQAIPGEEVITILKDGRLETKGVAAEGDFVVTNPTGEKYILSAEKFLPRYLAANEEGVYIANGHVRAIKNPTGVPIVIQASWGESQYGDENCFIVDVCDDGGIDMAGEPYLIDSDSFFETYRETESS